MRERAKAVPVALAVPLPLRGAMRDGITLQIEALPLMHEGAERRLDSNAVMNKLNEIKLDIGTLKRGQDTLNTKLFGNPDGDAGDEGRLVIAERRINSHANRIRLLEVTLGAGVIGAIVSLSKLLVDHYAR